MSYRVEITRRARKDIDRFAVYCRSHSQRFWGTQQSRLIEVLGAWLSTTPNTWSFFFATGAPYRAYLFDVGERTKYWIVYYVDENTKTVVILRFWNASRNPKRLKL